MKNELRNIISGISKVSKGAAIQAATGYLRANAGAISVAKESKLYKKQEEEELRTYINENGLWFPDSALRKRVGEGCTSLY